MSISSLYSRNRANPLDWSDFFDDFYGDAGDTPLNPWAVDTENTGVNDFVTDSACGVYRIGTGTDNETQSAQLSWGTNLEINLSKKPLFEARIKLTLSGSNALGHANQRMVWGVGTGQAAAETALDNSTINAWFRIEGTDGKIYTEVDDNVSGNDDDNDTGETIDESVYYTYAIDFQDLSSVKFFIDGSQVGAGLDLSAITANQGVEPYFCVHRTSDADTAELMLIDYVRVRQER